MADAAELHEVNFTITQLIIGVRTFYGNKSERAKYVPVLPQGNIVSDVRSSSDEEIGKIAAIWILILNLKM
ncbi:hypothetical protein HHI36_022415 [Cryptolaemus montrouzieri]|uniref:Uncharacterized protein n=1 Tax=Cryptolaemus montrouzieri TaxID=559131 RepID=A0ABD2MZZ4_9CUCU